MSDSTETPGLAEAREALVEHYKEWCDHPTGCGLPANHPEDFHTMQYPVDDMAMHLRAALAEVDRLTADLSALRIEHEAVCGLLTHTRRDRDEARDETQRLWDATKADRARMAELESRPGYDAAVRACARIVEGSVVPENAHRSILALLEPKP